MIEAETPRKKHQGYWLISGGLLALVVVVAVATLTQSVTHHTATRYLAALFGGLMVVAGNALPKFSRPAGGGYLRVVSRFERLAGWAFVLGGLLIAGLWFWMPDGSIPDLPPLATLAVLGACLLVLAALVWLSRAAWGSGNLSPDMRHHVMMRRALYHILHALLWAFAMFSVAALWDGVSNWLMVPFFLCMGLLDVVLACPLRKTC